MTTDLTNDAIASDVLLLDRADASDGHWVTIAGVHVHITHGKIDKGPSHLEGKTLGEAAKSGHHVTDVHGTHHPETNTKDGPAHNAEDDPDVRAKARAFADRQKAKPVKRSDDDLVTVQKRDPGAWQPPMKPEERRRASPERLKAHDAAVARQNSSGEKIKAPGTSATLHPHDGGPDAHVTIKAGFIVSGPKSLVGQRLSAVLTSHDMSTERHPARRAGQLSSAVYLSAPSEMVPAVTLGQPLPKDHNGLAIHYEWVDSAVAGDWHHPKTGQRIPIDGTRINGWVKNLRLALSRKVDVPAVKDHSEKADASLGAIYDARAKDGRLQLLAGFYGDDALGIARRNKVSVGIDPNFKDSFGNEYGESIRHLAFTPVPVIHGQQGFIAASRSEPTEPVYLSLAPLTKGVDMLDPALHGRVSQYLGDTATDDPNEVVTQLLAKLDAAPKADDVAKLSREREELATKVTKLSASVEPDPRYASLAYKAHKAEINADVSAGKYSRATGNLLLSRIEEGDGKPNVLLLSREDAGVFTIDDMIELARVSANGKAPGELTKGQTLTLLNREEPDAAEPSPLQSTIEAGRKEGAAFIARFQPAAK